MKPVRYATVFEAFANAVACQLVSLSAGMHVLNRLAEAFGMPDEADATLRCDHSRSRPQLRARILTRCARWGSAGRRGNISSVLRGWRSIRRIAISRRSSGSRDNDAIARLSKIRGVGRWTAEYVMLRGFGRINIFPGDDVGGRNKLFEWLGAGDAPTYDGVGKMLERWHPYGGLIYLHLIVNAVVDGGHVAA